MTIASKAVTPPVRPQKPTAAQMLAGYRLPGQVYAVAIKNHYGDPRVTFYLDSDLASCLARGDFPNDSRIFEISTEGAIEVYARATVEIVRKK